MFLLWITTFIDGPIVKEKNYCIQGYDCKQNHENKWSENMMAEKTLWDNKSAWHHMKLLVLEFVLVV